MVSIELRGEREVVELFNKAYRIGEPKEIRDAFRPAGFMVRAAIRDEAPVLTGRLRRAVVMKSGKGPAIFVAVDRKKALSISPKYPTGFPYANAVISTKRRGAKADKFVHRGWEKTQEAAGNLAVENLAKAFDRIVR